MEHGGCRSDGVVNAVIAAMRCVPRSVRRWALLAVAVCAVLGGPVAAAQASDNTMRATLMSYRGTFDRDEAAIQKAENEYPQGKWRPLVRALHQEAADIHAEVSMLTPESPSTTAGARAKSEILRGLRLVRAGERSLAHYVQLAKGGALNPKAAAAIKTVRAGSKSLKAGTKLLRSTG